MPRTRRYHSAINSDIPPGPDLILEGAGDIWHIADVPKTGVRSITYDAATDSDYQRKIRGLSRFRMTSSRLAALKKKLVLSFDDGPDRRWTPKILDILKEKKVPAVFFVDG